MYDIVSTYECESHVPNRPLFYTKIVDLTKWLTWAGCEKEGTALKICFSFYLSLP